MKLLYVSLVVTAIVSLIGLEIFAARLPHEALTPARIGAFAR
jgi:hypothetical protein